MSASGRVAVETSISTQVLGAAAAAVTFQAIPATFTHLRLLVVARCDAAAVNANMILTFNNDGTASYDTEVDEGIGAAASAASVIASTAAFLPRIPGATEAAGVPGVVDLLIPAYAAATFNKVLVANGGGAGQLAANTDAQTAVAAWRSAAAVNRIDLKVNGGANFVAGSTFSLYGLR